MGIPLQASYHYACSMMLVLAVKVSREGRKLQAGTGQQQASNG